MKAQAVLGALFIQPYVVGTILGLEYDINGLYRAMLSVVVSTF